MHRQDRHADVGRDRLRGARAAGRGRDGDETAERAARLLAAFAASTTDANRTIEALRSALPAERRPAAHEAFFSSDRKWSGLAFDGGETPGTYVLGAPEMLAPALGAGAEAAWREQADAWAARGLRVVLFCGRDDPVAFGDPDTPPVLPEGLKPVALISFSDELREGVQATLKGFSDAGIAVKVISGDNPKTVVALAKQAGMQSLQRREGVDSYCDMVNAAARRDARPAVDRRRPRPSRPPRPSASSSPSPAPSSRSSRPRSSRPRPTRPPSSAASRPSRSRTSSRPCATAGATSR